MDGVIAKMESLGATVVRFDLPEYDTLAPVIATSQLRSAHRDGPLFRDASAQRADQELRAARRGEDLRRAEDAGRRRSPSSTA